MSTCNIEGAVKYLEDVMTTLKADKNYKALKALKTLKKNIEDNRARMIRASSFAGAGAININDPYKDYFQPAESNEGPKQYQPEPPKTDNIAGFKIGEVTKNVPVEELMELIDEIAEYADSSRGITKTESTKKYNQAISSLIKAYVAGTGRLMNVRLVNSLGEMTIHDKNTGLDTVREPLGMYNRQSNTITIGMNPNHKSVADAAVKVSTGKVILHEIVHGLTVEHLVNSPVLFDRVTKLREHAIAMYKKANGGKAPSMELGSETYGLRNNADFVAEAVTSHGMQKMLAKISPVKAQNIITRIRNIFSSLLKKIKKQAGVAENSYTLLDEALEAVDAVLKNDETLTAEEQSVIDALTGQDEKAPQKEAEPTSGKGYEFDGGNGKTYTTNAGQTLAIDTMVDWFSSKTPHFLLQGRGGTGKTTVINVLLNKLKVHPKDVIFATPTNKATKVIENINQDNKYADSDYKTIASLLSMVPNEVDGVIIDFKVDRFADKVPMPKVLIVDEASMIHSSNYEMLLERAEENGTRIIFMGDHAQMPPIKDPNAKVKSVVFTDNEDSTIHLNQLMRQDKDSPIITFTDFLIGMVNTVENYIETGKPHNETEALTNFVKFDGNVFDKTVEGTLTDGVTLTNEEFDKVLPHFIKDYKKDPEGTRYIHFNRYNDKTTTGNTQQIRKALYGKAAETSDYLKGEPLVLNAPRYPAPGAVPVEDVAMIDNGEEFTVVRIGDVEDRHIVYMAGGKEIVTAETLPVRELHVTNNITGLPYSFLKPNVSNYQVDAFTEREKKNTSAHGVHPQGAHQLKKYLAEPLSHGYVINSHKAQGSTYTNVYMDVGNILGQKRSSANSKAKSLYVAASRPKKRLVVIDNRKGGASSVINGSGLGNVNDVPEVFSGVDSAETTSIINKIDKCVG